MKIHVAPLLVLALLACRQQPAASEAPEAQSETNAPAAGPNADMNASLQAVAEAPSHSPQARRFVGRWAPTAPQCANDAWRFTEDRLETPSGSACRFSDVREVPGGYDIAARCTAGAPERDDVVKLRFVESIGGMTVETESLPDMGMIRCPG